MHKVLGGRWDTGCTPVPPVTIRLRAKVKNYVRCCTPRRERSCLAGASSVGAKEDESCKHEQVRRGVVVVLNGRAEQVEQQHFEFVRFIMLFRGIDELCTEVVGAPSKKAKYFPQMLVLYSTFSCFEWMVISVPFCDAGYHGDEKFQRRIAPLRQEQAIRSAVLVEVSIKVRIAA